VITNDVSDYTNLFARIARIIYNHTLYDILSLIKFTLANADLIPFWKTKPIPKRWLAFTFP